LNSGVSKAASDLREVNEILKMQQEHAQSQQPNLNSAEVNVTTANGSIVSGVKELEAAKKYRRGWYDDLHRYSIAHL
jgi:hypothetical protein